MIGYEKYLTNKDKPLFVAFGGISMGLHMPPFEFKNFLTSSFGDVNFIFIRDNKQSWYFKGINELSTDHESNVEGIRNLIKESGCSKVIFIGNSMGGFASILYGALLNVDVVLAFAPQTFIDKENRGKYKDTRWSEQINSLHKEIPTNRYYDLSNISDISYETKIKLFCGVGGLDTTHVEHISNISNTEVNKIGIKGHGVIKHLKNNGELKKIIKNII